MSLLLVLGCTGGAVASQDGSAPGPAPQSPAILQHPATGPAGANQPGIAPGTFTVEEAVSLAVRQNPRLSAAARDVVAARAGVRSARALTNPTVTFTPSLFGSGSDEEILFQQPLELNGTRSARAGVAKAQLRQKHATALIELRNLVADTRTAYFELARTQELRTVAQAVLRTAEEFHRGVSRQAQEGLRPEIDPVQTEIEINRARQQLTLAESQVLVAQAALNTLLGRATSEPVGALPLTEMTPVSNPPGAAPPNATAPTPTQATMSAGVADRETLTAQALAGRSEIAVEAALREQFQQEARLARAQGRPDLVPQFRTESVLREPRQPGIGIGISLPFLDYGSRRHRIRQAEASAQAQAARITAAQNQVRQEVDQAVARLQAAEQIVRSYQSGVLQQSRRLLESSLRALQLGAPGASILTALEAQRTFRGVLTEYTNALASLAQSRAALERATAAVPAELLPEAGSSSPANTATPPSAPERAR